MSVYIGQAGVDRIAMARRILDRHAAETRGRWCYACPAPAPCGPTESAERTLRRYGLPTSGPGELTRPSLPDPFRPPAGLAALSAP